METLEKPQVCETDLEALGFTKAAESLKSKRELARKMRIAFEHYSVITPEAITKFNQDLLARTKKVTDKYGSYTHQYLNFTPIMNYTEIPPVEALLKLKEAKAKQCFDGFEIATIETNAVSKIPDPLLVGIITGCANKYFIAQWDEDVRIEDILKPDELV